MPTEKEIWLAQVIEDPIDPDLPICDPHHHWWDRPASRYMLEELAADVADHNVVSTVFVECMSGYREDGPEAMRPVGETDFVEAEADRSVADKASKLAAAAAIVSYTDLRFGAAATESLEAHRAASPGRFRGIRHACGWDAHPDVRRSHTKPPEHLYLDPTFREGFACLAPLGMTFDAWHYHTQIHELTDLARAFPETTIILDHFGGPLGIGPYAGKREEVFEHWSRALAELATCPNVVVKIGGLLMPVNGFGFHKRETPPDSEEVARVTSPYYLFTIEKFGPERCMFESNFPVDKQSCSYTVLWNSFKRIVADFSDDEKAQLFRGTAERIYRIGRD